MSVVLAILIAILITPVVLFVAARFAFWCADKEFEQQYDTFWKPVLNMPDDVTAQDIIQSANGDKP